MPVVTPLYSKTERISPSFSQFLSTRDLLSTHAHTSPSENLSTTSCVDEQIYENEMDRVFRMGETPNL